MKSREHTTVIGQGSEGQGPASPILEGFVYEEAGSNRTTHTEDKHGTSVKEVGSTGQHCNLSGTISSRIMESVLFFFNAAGTFKDRVAPKKE